MPLTRKGKKVLREFKIEYGEKGKGFFYSYIKKFPQRTKLWHNQK